MARGVAEEGRGGSPAGRGRPRGGRGGAPVAVSLLLHGAVFLLLLAAPVTRPRPPLPPPPLSVEIEPVTEAELASGEPLPPAPESGAYAPSPPQATVREAEATARAPSRSPSPAPPPAPGRPDPAGWLDGLEGRLAAAEPRRPAAAPPSPRSPAVAPAGRAPSPAPAPLPARASDAFASRLDDLDRRVRGSRPVVTAGGEEGEGESVLPAGGEGKAVPPWVRDMIRRKVRSYLPQLQEIYGEALRRDPSLRGKVVVRFVVGPSGAVERAEAAGGTVRDEAFTGAVAGRVRRWTFEPARELPVEVSYPFSFRPPA